MKTTDPIDVANEFHAEPKKRSFKIRRNYLLASMSFAAIGVVLSYVFKRNR